MQEDKDYFEMYLEKFPDFPSLVLVRAVEARNIHVSLFKQPILDLCCGDGFFSSTLGLKDISGCDMQEDSLRLARKKDIYRDLRNCDIRTLSFEDNSFNTVLSNCALEHVEDINIALSEVNRVLTGEGAKLIMTVPARVSSDDFPLNKFFKAVGMANLGRKLFDKYNKTQGHRNLLSFTQWEKLLSESGLKILRHFYIFDKRNYKIVMMYDWLFTLRVFNIIYFPFKLIIPCSVRKALWRRLLKQIYIESTQLENGGELVIIAER